MTARDHDEIRRDLGVYVLGALEPTERDRVEEHLSQCPACRDEVASLAVVPSLLRHVDPDHDAVAEVPPVGAVIQRLAAHRRRARRRDRVLAAVAALAGVAAVAAIAAGLLPGGEAPGRPFVAETGDVVATVEERAWGMAMSLEARGLPRRPGYVALAVAEDGHSTQVASWSDTGRPVTVDGACYLKPDEVTRVEILAAPEEEVLAVLRPAAP